MQKPQEGTSLAEDTEHVPFELRAAAALGIAVVADALDYLAAPLFALPVVGDISDIIVSGLLYSITRSKKAAVINAIEFIPVIGDFVPAYTISTLLWIGQELSKRKKLRKSARLGARRLFSSGSTAQVS
ncbi:MAG TPA: hypothetical protein VH677_00105 [Nitrososphaera sp.]|jgi:hypothetical protein